MSCGRRPMRAAPPHNSCLQSAAAAHHHHHPLATLLLPGSQAQQQYAAVGCILHLWRVWALLCRCWALSVIFKKKPYIISLLALYDFHSLNKHTHSEIIWISFFAGSSIWASGARRRWRPSTLTMPWTTCEQFPLLSKMDSLGLPRFLDLDNFKDARSSGPPAKSTCQKTTRSRFFMSLVLCISGSLNLAALDIF